MIPAVVKIVAGMAVLRDADGETYTVENVYGRGRNRQARLDRRPPGKSSRAVYVRTLRAYYRAAPVVEGRQ